MTTAANKRTGKLNRRVRKIRSRARHTRRELERIAATPTLGGLFLSLLKIGLVGFGGGLAVIAQIRSLTVIQRRWLSDQEFAEGLSLAQTLPGTAAGNTATYVGFRLRGWLGASVAMAGFILPSMLMMIVLAILYKHLRLLPDTQRLFHGLNAAVVAVVIVTAWRMGRRSLHVGWQWLVAVTACAVVTLFGATVIEVVLAAGVFGVFMDSFAEQQLRKLAGVRDLAARRRKRITARIAVQRRRRRVYEKSFVGGYLTRALAEDRVHKAELAAKRATENGVSDLKEVDDETGPGRQIRSFVLLGVPGAILVKFGVLALLATMFFRIGAITFGGGLVMIPLIESEVVSTHGWLSHQEFADATALGQITPGPVLITATFIGYRVGGTLGALVATISIFLPAFLMTIAAGSSLARFRTNRVLQSFLKGVSPAVVGLLVAAGISIGRAGIHTWMGFALMILSAVVLIRYRPNAFWIILGAGVVRFVLGFWLG